MQTSSENQWLAANFHRHVDQALKEDPPGFGLTLDEMRELYLMMWLQLSVPAGNA